MMIHNLTIKRVNKLAGALNKEYVKNKLAVKDLNKMSMAYSLRKMSTNTTEAYSTLNPDTSSLSPSAKSKGVRFASAIVMINHRMNNLGAHIAGLGHLPILNSLKDIDR